MPLYISYVVQLMNGHMGYTVILTTAIIIQEKGLLKI